MPSKDLERVVKKVQNDRKSKGIHWDSFCSSNEDKDELKDEQASGFQILSRNEIDNILGGDKKGGSLFGPSRKMGKFLKF